MVKKTIEHLDLKADSDAYLFLPIYILSIIRYDVSNYKKERR